MPPLIRLVAVGKIKEPHLAAGMAEFEKRLHPYCKLEIVELKDEGMEKEAEKMEKYSVTNPNAYILDAAGRQLDSLEFSKLVKSAELASPPLTFIIGGPDGIAPELKKKAKTISLSKMTFTHEMCRLFLLEQLYRAYQIAQNRPYHR